MRTNAARDIEGSSPASSIFGRDNMVSRVGILRSRRSPIVQSIFLFQVVTGNFMIPLCRIISFRLSFFLLSCGFDV